MRPKRAPHMPTQAEVAAHEIMRELYVPRLVQGVRGWTRLGGQTRPVRPL